MSQANTGRGLSLLEVFAGLKPPNLIARPSPLVNFRSFDALGAENMKKLMDLHALREAMRHVHKEVSEKSKQTRTQAQRYHNARRNVVPINFMLGDFVMIKNTLRQFRKLHPSWRGPRKVLRVISITLF